MRRHLEYCLDQSIPPNYIFACFLGLPKEQSHLIGAFKNLTKDLDNVYIIESDFNFKYIGRYQIALGAPTEYIIMLDDDRFPRFNYAETMLKIIDKKECLVQQFGWLLDKTESNLSAIEGHVIEGIVDMGGSFYAGWTDCKSLDEPALTEVDYLCGGMVFRKSSLRYLFAEDFPTKTGEDICFCLRCKKNNIPSYAYLPSKDSENELLLHNNEGVAGTANNLKALIYRSKLIRKELGLSPKIKITPPL